MVVEVLVEDRIRGAEGTVPLHEQHTVAMTLRRLIEHFDLPWRTLKKRPLTYRLARPGPDGDMQFFDPDQEMAELHLIDGETLVLSSPEASSVWAEINGLLGKVENELQLHVDKAREDVSEAVTADVSRRLTNIRSEIEQMARQRLRANGSRPPLHKRLRARKLMGRLAQTGISQDEVAGVRVGLSQLTTAASYAFRAAPFVAGAAVVGASAVAVEAADDDLTEADLQAAVEEALDEVTDTGGGTGGGGGDDGTDGEGGDDGDDGEGGDDGGDGLDGADHDAVTIARIEELLVAELDGRLSGVLTEDNADLIIREAVESVLGGEEFLGVIRREVPAAEQDQTSSSALGRLTPDSPSQPLVSGDTLWSVAVAAQRNPPAGCADGPFDESIAVYVRRIWAANAGTLGGDPDAIDPADGIRVPCPE